MEQIQKNLNEIYAADAKNTRKAASLIVNLVDDKLCSGDFDFVESLFEHADLDKMSNTAIVCFLGITLGARDKLVQRAKFFERVMAKCPDKEKLFGKYK